MKTKDITTKQNDIMLFLSNHHQQTKKPATLKEIALAIGITSTAGAHHHISELIRKKVLRAPIGKTCYRLPVGWKSCR